MHRVLVGLVVLITVHLSRFALDPALAQVPDDTLLSDSLAQDTTDYTARFLEAQGKVTERVPVMPMPGVRGPAPALTRMVFNRDSIEWGNATTLGDLLAQVPGVFIWRGGFIGRPEPVNFQGRGATSAEYYLDGLPYVPAGVDSVAVDPGLISLTFLDRIEVERWAGQLRVHLFTRRHDRRAPRSRIGIARGDRDYARYDGSLERRGESGIGFAVAADYLNSPTSSGSSSDYSNTQVWLQGGYVPTGRFGVQYQLLRSSPKRDPFVRSSPTAAEDTIGLGFDATRTDAQLRVALRKRPDGLGSSLDLVYGRTAWDSRGIDQQINQVGGWVGHRGADFSVGAMALHRSRWTPLDVRGSAAWSGAVLSAAAEAAYQRHRGGRHSNFVGLSAGLHPIRGFALTGSARFGEQVAAPSIFADTAQKLTDLRAAIGWERDRLALELEWARTSEFSPFAYAEFPRLPTLTPLPEVQWVTVRARIRPLRWIALEGWYSDPRDVDVEGLPPTHSAAAVTLRSKFLRQFPSGAFDLKLRLSVETWGTGVIGRDTTGAPVPIRGATFVRSLIQIQLQSFALYWDRGNLTRTALPHVPGFRIPNYGTTFGVRWEFLN